MSIPPSDRQFCGRTRREFFWETGNGFTGLALAGLLGTDFFARQTVAADGVRKFVNPLAPKEPHFKSKAKSVIFIFCYGGPSPGETFYYKPKLYPLHGKTNSVKTIGRGRHQDHGRRG